MDLGQLAFQNIQALGVGAGQQAEQAAQRLSDSGGLKGADRTDIEKAANIFRQYFSQPPMLKMMLPMRILVEKHSLMRAMFLQ